MGMPQHSTAQHSTHVAGPVGSQMLQTRRNLSFLMFRIRRFELVDDWHSSRLCSSRDAGHEDTVQLAKVKLSMHDPSCSPGPMHALADRPFQIKLLLCRAHVDRTASLAAVPQLQQAATTPPTNPPLSQGVPNTTVVLQPLADGTEHTSDPALYYWSRRAVSAGARARSVWHGSHSTLLPQT